MSVIMLRVFIDSSCIDQLLRNTIDLSAPNISLKRLGHVILGNFSTGQMAIELTKI